MSDEPTLNPLKHYADTESLLDADDTDDSAGAPGYRQVLHMTIPKSSPGRFIPKHCPKNETPMTAKELRNVLRERYPADWVDDPGGATILLGTDDQHLYKVSVAGTSDLQLFRVQSGRSPSTINIYAVPEALARCLLVAVHHGAPLPDLAQAPSWLVNVLGDIAMPEDGKPVRTSDD